MYQLGHKRPPERRTGRYVVTVLLVVAVIATAFVLWDANKNTQITKSSTDLKTSAVTTTAKNSLSISEPLFTLELPGAWKETGRAQKPLRYIDWRSTASTTSARSLKLYIDTIPQTLAVTRLLPVSVDGNRLIAADTSNNCATFVGPPGLTAQQASKLQPVEAKWQNVRFICDLPNYVQEVAGSGSSEGINVVSVTGPVGGKHRYFFVYTDHTAQPDFGIFETIVNSFRAK